MLLNSAPTEKHLLYYNSNFFYEHYPNLFRAQNHNENPNSLEYYQTNESYFIKEIDVNQDDIPNLVVSNRG